VARPRLKIDPEQVRGLARLHCTNKEIASVIGCSTDTLERRYAAEISKGKEEGRAALRRLQWKAANAGNIAMLIWLGKNHLGQTDRQDVTSAGQQQPIAAFVIQKKPDA
jgi:hypothetical protein